MATDAETLRQRVRPILAPYLATGPRDPHLDYAPNTLGGAGIDAEAVLSLLLSQTPNAEIRRGLRGIYEIDGTDIDRQMSARAARRPLYETRLGTLPVPFLEIVV